MKKGILCLLLCFSFLLYGESKIEQMYQKYPFQNPLDATIIGSSMLMMEGVSEEIPLKNYEIESPEALPEILWHQKTFDFPW